MSVADAHDDDVALIALDVLQILHEQAAEHIILLADVFCLQPRGESGVLVGEPAKRSFQFTLLCFRECY